MNQPVRIWVDPQFRRKLKKEAIENDESILKFTKRIATKDDPIVNAFNNEEKKKKRQNKYDIIL